MPFSRSARIITLLVIDSLFFLLEISVGYAVHSLALVADSFHMLNDVFSLIVALWAIRLATKKGDSHYTYGWQRAEVLGALVNGVFLLALCLSIFLEAIQRFVEPQGIQNPILVLAVGGAGLASNILGLFLFHDHGHSHGGHDHGHSHDGEEAGHAGLDGVRDNTADAFRDEDGDIESVLPANVVKRVTRSISPRGRGRAYSGSHRHSGDVRRPHFASPDADIYVHPAQNRREIQSFGRTSPTESAVSDTEANEDENTPLFGDGAHSSKSARKNGHQRGDSKSWHAEHHHSKPKAEKAGGHSHQNLNMRGVFLHVLGDALGNVGVILTAIFVKYSPQSKILAPLTNYADPFISLVITVIISMTALPLVRSASKILLQGVPNGISLEEVKEDITSIPDVESVHELHIWQLSDVKMIASLHIQIGFDPEEGGGGRYMRLARAIRTCLHEVGVHSSTIQPEYRRTGAILAATSGSGYGYGSIQNEAGEACLMECTVDCGGGKCCGPPVESTDAHGHGNGHSH